MAVIAKIQYATQRMESFVTSTERLVAPIENGRDYLQKHHKDASGGVADMLEQMRSTVAGALSAVRNIAAFADGGAQGDFERRLTAADEAIATAKKRIPLLKGSCTRIGEIADELGRRFVGRAFWAIFGPEADKRARQLSRTMNEIYLHDEAMTRQVSELLDAGREAVKTARAELRKPGGLIHAQAFMSEQAEALAPAVEELRALRDRIGAMVTAFDRPVAPV
jgi:hypothetical protein